MLTVRFEVDILQFFLCVHRNLKESYNNITINTGTTNNNVFAYPTLFYIEIR